MFPKERVGILCAACLWASLLYLIEQVMLGLLCRNPRKLRKCPEPEVCQHSLFTFSAILGWRGKKWIGDTAEKECTTSISLRAALSFA